MLNCVPHTQIWSCVEKHKWGSLSWLRKLEPVQMKTNFIVGAEAVKPGARGSHLDWDTMSDHGNVLASLAWNPPPPEWWIWLP